MKTKFILTAILLLTVAASAAAQNRIRLFDPMNIALSDYVALANATPWGSYNSAEVYLSCPAGEQATSWLTGPNGGGFAVDNVLVINGRNACGGHCFTTFSDPMAFLGMPVESAYAPVGPFNVGSHITGSGPYKFNLIDIGYTNGATAVYLETSCSIIPVNVPDQGLENNVICHRNSGGRGSKTITVGGNAVEAHLAHGDTLGPCAE